MRMRHLVIAVLIGISPLSAAQRQSNAPGPAPNSPPAGERVLIERSVRSLAVNGVQPRDMRVVAISKRTMRGGREEEGVVVAVANPGQSRFWWTYRQTPSGGDSTMVATDVIGRITLVSDNDELRVFAATATTLTVAFADEPFTNDADLPKLARAASERGRNDSQNARRIDLSFLGHEFFEIRGDARPLPPLRLVDVKRLLEHWEITAVTGGNRVAVVKLSMAFEIIDVNELPPIEDPAARPTDPIEAERLRRLNRPR